MRRLIGSMLALCVLVCVFAAACAGKPSAVSARAPAPGAATLDERRRQLTALLDEQWQYTLRTSPVFASKLGDRRYNDRWGDNSFEAIAADLAASREFLTRFEAIDTTGFPEQEVLNQQLMVRRLKQQLDTARFEDWLMPVNQLWGDHLWLAQVPAQLPFATVKDYDDYAVRLRTLPEVIEQMTALMKRGLEKHIVPPRILLEQCVGQTDALAGGTAEDSSFAQPLTRFPSEIAAADRDRIRAAILAAVRDRVQPAYRALAAFLRDDYVPHGRLEVGMSALPDGAARYRAEIQRVTTTDLTADQIHQIGLDEVTRIEREEAAIARRLGFADLAALRRHVRASKQLYATGREDILARYRRYTDQMYARLPELFGRLPRQRMTIEPVEAFRDQQAPAAEYHPGAPDGSRPGMVQVSTSDATRRLTLEMEATAYHEGVPGHHLQVAIQQELGALPPFRQQGGYGAYDEGWALYAERLGKEVGFYQDPYSDYGRLQNEIWRAIRLVVDTGLHARRWTREQVVQFFHDHSMLDEPNVQAETDRYIAIPGQALGYKIGELTILRLRDRAEAALGPRFDLRAFHDQILGAGALPLDLLERRVAAWIAARAR